MKRVLESDKETPVSEDWYVEQNSGMVGIVPTWKIEDVLDSPEQIDMRKQAESASKARIEDAMKNQSDTISRPNPDETS